MVARPFLIAWHFLTAIPLSHRHHDPTPGELACSMCWFPVIGLFLGAVLAASAALLSGTLARSVTDLLLVVLLVALTRGLHQDGLADALDGLAGGRTPAERLAIMRDGRIGAIGATGLILALGLRYAGLSALPQPERLALLVCLPAIGRWAMVLGAVAAPYARAEGGLAEPFLHHLSAWQVLIATIPTMLALGWAIGAVSAVLCLALVAATARAITAAAQRLCGGITGDILGAINETAEILFLIMAPLALNVA